MTKNHAMQNQKDIERLSYHTIFQSNEPVLWVDSEGTIQHLNQAACETSGYSFDEMLGKKTYDLHPDENEQTWKQRWKKLQEHGRLGFEKWQPQKDGKWARIKITQNLVKFDNKEYTVILIEDKTLEHHMRQQIQESERRLSTLMANLPGMAYRCRNDKQWTMEFVSGGCEKLTGYKSQELTFNHKISYNHLLIPEDRKTIHQVVNEQTALGKPFEFKYRIRKKSGEIRWVWERGIAVADKNGEYLHIEGFITDITDIKNAEEELKEKEKHLRILKNKLEEETTYLREEIKLNSNFEEIISNSDDFKKILKNVEQVASTDSTVLILGETGTGKELVARAIHNNSNRSNRSLVTINCAALPPEMIESELFGHEKGAFTGAYTKKTGRFELAHQGTIFLDEIGELPMNLQTKLLRVLQEGEFERLGNPETIKTDVRVIAATNRDLNKALRLGEFRKDLYYRLNVFPLLIPPLRKRKEDIPLLVNHFVKKYSSKTGKPIKQIPQKVMNILIKYDWPGNIRELENIIERGVIISNNGRLQPGNWLPDCQKKATNSLVSLQENEREHIIKALQETNWRVSGENGAAKLLGLKRTTLEARMKKLGIKRPK